MPSAILFSALILLLPSSASAAAYIEKSREKSQQEAVPSRQEHIQEAPRPSSQEQTQRPSVSKRSPQQKLNPRAESGQPQAEDVMNLTDIWRGFEASSKLCPDILDEDIKILTIQKYVEWFRDQGVVIQKPPYQYVDIIDTIAVENPGLLESSFKDVMMFTAIMEYDFNNGEDRDELARRILGEEMYQRNRQRFGLDK